MSIKFLELTEVQTEIEQLKKEIEGKQFSDISDAEGRQYVDLVMQGGGILGYSLLGYLHTIESVGIRPMGIAGTSAGAILTLLIAAQEDYQKTKASKVLEVLPELNFETLADGKKRVRSFMRKMLKKSSNRMNLIWNGTLLLNELTSTLGLNPGIKFYEWLKTTIAQFGIRSTHDLLQKRANYPELFYPDGSRIPDENIFSELAIIAAEITTETKVVFPKMAELYWQHPNLVNPANFVRASMSIPFIFTPYIVAKVPQGEEAAKTWKKHSNFQGKIPKRVFFTDGGIMSNFPINIFHNPSRMPLKPTFGVMLNYPHTRVNNIRSPFGYIRAVFNSSRNALDKEFITENDEYRRLITHINTGNHKWLNFDMPDKDKADLFLRGVKSASEFLRGFDWASYKKMREISLNYGKPQA